MIAIVLIICPSGSGIGQNCQTPATTWQALTGNRCFSDPKSCVVDWLLAVVDILTRRIDYAVVMSLSKLLKLGIQLPMRTKMPRIVGIFFWRADASVFAFLTALQCYMYICYLFLDMSICSVHGLDIGAFYSI